MQRYLLFDASCFSCSGIAGQIQEIAGEWLAVRPFSDSDELLQQAGPVERNRPALLLQDNGRVTARQGLSLSVTLARGLGAHRSTKILALIAREMRAPGINRRSALAGFGGAIALTLTGASAVHAETPRQLSSEEENRLRAEALDAEAVQQALQQADGDGFDPDGQEVAILPGDDGEHIVMIFLAHRTEPESDAAVVIHDVQQGSARTALEYVSGSVDQLLDDDGVHAEALSVRRRQGPEGMMQPMGTGAYISCIVACVGANCAVPAMRCRALIVMQAVLACMVIACGSKARTCHGVCKHLW